MTTIGIQEVQRDPRGCLRRVGEGETLVVLRDEQPVAEIKPVPRPPQASPAPPRPSTASSTCGSDG
jgi:antitoxin (DNA-binding transcriptional repressor) of toxin-antitoxin stability system